MSGPYRIAVFHNLPSGGQKRALHELVRHLRRSHIVDIYTLTTADEGFLDTRPLARRHVCAAVRQFDLENSPLPLLNPLLKAWEIGCTLGAYRRVADQIDSKQYDCVFVHPCIFFNSPPILRHANTPTLFYAPEPWRKYYETPEPRPYALEPHDLPRRIAYAPVSRWLRRIDRASMRAATRIVTNSRFTRSCLETIYGVAADVAYLGVDTEKFHPMDIEREHFVLSAGSLTPKKGFAFLVESLALIPKQRRPSLRLVCNSVWPPERAYVERLAAERHVEVHVEAGISDAQLVRLYNMACLMVYAPIREPFGLAALEAMACGTPVVGVAEGGVRESVVHERTGLLAPRDPRAFAAVVERLLDSPSVCREYGSAAREHVLSHWTWAKAAARIESAIVLTVAIGRRRR